MTENAYKLYELADEAQSLAAEDIRAMEEIKELIGKAARIAKQTSDRMFGYSK